MTRPPTDFHLEQFLPYLVHRVGSDLAEGFDEGFAEAGVSLQEWRALSILYEYGPQTMGDIARRTSINASTMTRLMGQMEKRNLVKRERPVANQRTVFVRILADGRGKSGIPDPESPGLRTGTDRVFQRGGASDVQSASRKIFSQPVRRSAGRRREERKRPARRLSPFCT